MIHSMTGFGKSVVSLPNKNITVEIKSLNSKNMDLHARIPSHYREKELEMRNLISSALGRGKADFSLWIDAEKEKAPAKINRAVVGEYLKELDQFHQTGLGQQVDLLKIAMTLPDTLKTEKEEVDESEFEAVKKAIKEALEALNQFRMDEGEALKKDFELRAANLRNLLGEIIQIDPERIQGVRERLQKGVAELKENVDENRFEQELVYYIEKYDITEEKTRLENHLNYFLETLNSPQSNGKKLGFISQEIGREINTIGSKSNYAPMQHLVVQMKDELEKIKEQMLNVL